MSSEMWLAGYGSITDDLSMAGNYQTHTRIVRLHILISSVLTNNTVHFVTDKATIIAFETPQHHEQLPFFSNYQTGTQARFFRLLE